MAPPQHVKLISGTASTALLVLGLRNLFAPGAGIPFFPRGERNLQAYFWGTRKPDELVPAQKACSRLSGLSLVALAVAKLTIVLTNSNEGTFLRRNLFVALGATQVAGSVLLTAGESEGKAREAGGGASFWTYAVVLGAEGLVLLHDAFLRDRPVKAH